MIEGGNQALGDSREVLVQRVDRFDPVTRTDDAIVGLVEQQDVDVAPRIELATSQLAHADDHERARLPGGRTRFAEAGLRPCECLRERELAADVGEVRELARGDVDVLPRIRQELARCHSELLARSKAAKSAHHARRIGEIADGDGREPTVRAKATRPPDARGNCYQILGMGVDGPGKGRISAREQSAELHEVGPGALSYGSESRGDPHPRIACFVGCDVVRAHAYESSASVRNVRPLQNQSGTMRAYESSPERQR